MTNPARQSRLPAQAASEAFIKSKMQFLVDISVWPGGQSLDPRAWLNNFLASERSFALNLLNVFLYYNEQLVDALFSRAVQQLSTNITKSSTSLTEANKQWQFFLESVCVTYVEGEERSPTDSGLVFARKARQVLGIDQGQIVRPEQALERRLRKPACPILFVDDFVGSGRQMKITWYRQHSSGSGRTHTFAEESIGGGDIFYVPIISTAYGLNALASCCPGLKVHPSHILDNRYSLVDPDSILWPEALRPDASNFLLEASRRAGILDELKEEWMGFHNLALALAFSHSVPDATLPLYFWDRRGWAPLIRRT